MIALAVALALVVQDTSITRIESLLAAGDVRPALKIATKLVERRPSDPVAHMVLGRVHYARPVVGRFPALEEFRTAARLAPADPEPLYWQMKVGFYLRSDDGDWIAREALLGLFAVDPNYKDAWERFRDVYRGPDIWRRAERALARHGDQPVALEHRAELSIALGEPERADSLLAVAASILPATVSSYLLRAESNVLAGRASVGFAWHDSALARAEEDASDALWDEAWLIASPAEVARHEALVPGERRAFFEHFWAQRDPNLLTHQNERLQEHYGRRAEARRMYRLLHPQRTLYHSKLARALARLDDYRDMVDPAPAPGVMPGPSWDLYVTERRAAAMSQRALQDTAVPLAFRAGFTAPGLVFLRYGKPDMQANCVSDLYRQGIFRLGCTGHLDEEAWFYWTPDGPLSVHFRRNEFFEPTSREQLHHSYVLLTTDRTTLPAPLVVRAWTAVFMGAELGLTDAYFKARGDSFAVALWNEAETPVKATGTELVRLSVPPGPYDLGLDVDSAGVLGRIRSTLTVPIFSLVDLNLSSLVLAPIDHAASLPDRETALRGMPADLSFRSGVPLAAYLEIYGLGLERDNRARYQVRYTFAPLKSTFARLFGGSGGARPVVFEFERGSEFSIARERLVIEPDKLAAGRYRVTVAVTDLTRNVKSESVALDITIR